MRISIIQEIIDKFRKKKTKGFCKIQNTLINDFIIKDLKKVGFTINDESNIIASSNGIKLNILFQPFVIWEVFTKGDYLLQGKEENSILIDIGMNIGAVSLMYAAKEWVEKVYAFEPFKPTYEEALSNIKLNPELESKIITFPFGLGKNDEEKEFLYCSDAAGAMSTTCDVYSSNPIFAKYKEKAKKEVVNIKNAACIIEEIIRKEGRNEGRKEGRKTHNT